MTLIKQENAIEEIESAMKYDESNVLIAGLACAKGIIASLPSATKKLNNQIHLCDSCKYDYPNCPSENEDVLFGNGVGNDNICCCAKYIASIDRPHGEWINRENCQVDEDAYEVATCSNCKSEITIEYPNDNFCPNCGCVMI